MITKCLQPLFRPSKLRLGFGVIILGCVLGVLVSLVYYGPHGLVNDKKWKSARNLSPTTLSQNTAPKDDKVPSRTTKPPSPNPNKAPHLKPVDDKTLKSTSDLSPKTVVKERVPAKDVAVVTKSLPPCPEKSPYLIGAIRENLETKTYAQLENDFRNSKKYGAEYSSLGPGGHFYPKECTPRQKLAILIPFRDRHHHLPILLNHLVPVLRRQLLDFRFYIIEQEPGVTFNRGILFNIGVVTALQHDKFDCVAFHDVDCLPLNDNIFYQCGDHPRHLLAAGSKWNFGLSYPQFNGGALLMSREQFLKINGFSNLYFGWGSEDDDIRIRILRKGNKVVRYPRQIGRYHQLTHKRDDGNEENAVRFVLVRQADKRMDQEGLRSTVFKVRSVEEKPLFVWIRASVNMTQVLQTAPNIDKRSIKVLWDAAANFDRQGLGHSEKGDKPDLPL